MGIKSKGRGTAAAFGLLLLFAGLVGGGVLYFLSVRHPGQAIDSFARAPVGCTTTLDFTETGRFYVYEEVDTVVVPPEGGCVPLANPLRSFGFELTGPDGEVVPRRDDSISYDHDGQQGQSVARIEIEQTGQYEIAVVGDDELTVAAVGRAPDDGVDDLRNRAIAVGLAGVVLGLLLLTLAGRRSRKAAEYATPDGPGWGPSPSAAGPAWPPEAPRLDQVPVNPHDPEAPAVAAPPLPERTKSEASSPWAPPSTDDAADDDAPPSPPPPPPAAPPPPPPPPPPTPTRPDTPGRSSGA